MISSRPPRSPVSATFRACDAPATKRLLRRRRIAIGAAFVCGMLLIVLGVFVRAAHVTDRRDATSGRDPDATISSIVPHTGGTGPGSTSVMVTFHTPDGAEHTGELLLDRAAIGYAEGDTVTVLFDVDDPTRFSIEGETVSSEPVPWFVFTLLGLLLVSIGVVAARWQRWANKVLAENPWVEVGATLVERAAGGGSRKVILRMLALRGAPDDTTLAAPVSWRALSLAEFVPTAWIAGADRRFLVASPGGGSIRRMRRVRLVDAEPRGGTLDMLTSRHDTPS